MEGFLNESGCIMDKETVIRHLVKLLVLVTLTVMLLLAVYSTVAANGDFSLRLNIDGNNLSELETIVINPERDLTIDLHIFNVTREVTLEKILVVVTFAGQPFLTLSENLGNHHIEVGGDYHPDSITVNVREMPRLGGVPLVTGIYRAVIKLEYTVGDQQQFWSEPKNIKIPGNPFSTLFGGVGAVTSGGVVAAILMLVRSLISPGIPAGATIPTSASISSLPRLRKLAAERLEPTTRGRVMGNVVKAAKGRIIKKRCPICRTYFKHSYCYTCKKSAKEVRNEYQSRVRTLALQSSKLLASGQVVTLNDLCSSLGISATLGTDVMATLKHAKLVKIKGVSSKLMGKAIMVGIGSGLSAVLWITVGGFAVLSSSVLIAILVASVVLPITVAKGLQMKARRDLKKHTK
jgi:hypothetical protein